MNIAFYIDEMNFRGVQNQTFQLAFYNKKILKNNSIIFYNKLNTHNKKEVIKKFEDKFIIHPIKNFKEIENFKDKHKIDYAYFQKGGNIDKSCSTKIKTLIHAVYPQKLNQKHGYNYAYISEWLSKNFSNNKIPFIPYIVKTHKTKKNLKKELKIKNNQFVLGCHGGESSFDLKFAQDVIKKIVKIRKDLTFIFMNINKFCTHSRVKFLKGTTDESLKKKFINTCDGMIYGRSLGESFGLACAEFAIHNKFVISYKYNRHQNHKYSIPKSHFYEYSSFKELFTLLNKLKKIKKKNKNNKYKNLSPVKVMKDFKRCFLKKKIIPELKIQDYILNYLNFFKMHYFYLRHKLYNHYYNYIESLFEGNKH